jgi:hypothetical protein
VSGTYPKCHIPLECFEVGSGWGDPTRLHSAENVLLLEISDVGSRQQNGL